MSYQPHSLVCTGYMRAPAVGNDDGPLAIHAAQSHDNVNDTMGLSCGSGTLFPAAGTHCTTLTSNPSFVVGHLPACTQPVQLTEDCLDWIQL